MSPRNGNSSDRTREAISTVRKVLEQAQMNPEPLEDGGGFRVVFADDGPPVDGVAHILPDEERFVFYLEFKKRAPKDARPKVAEFITRANYGISIGNFELDYSNGGVRYKTSIDFDGHKLPPVYVRNAILAAMDSVELYSDALLKVMADKLEPQQAIDEAEGAVEAE